MVLNFYSCLQFLLEKKKKEENGKQFVFLQTETCKVIFYANTLNRDVVIKIAILFCIF